MAGKKINTVKLLEQWGLWSRGSGVNLRTKSVMAISMELVAPPENKISAQITPEQIAMVEEGMAALRIREESMWLIIKLTYIFDMGRKQISEFMKISEHAARQVLSDAEMWLDSYFFNFAKAA